MYYNGLVSISFRNLSPEEIMQAMQACGLKYIEWGSDVHAPCTDDARLAEIVELQKKYGITCCSYGTYFRFAVTPMEELPAYIRAAKILGTDTLRLWAGKRSDDKYTPEEKEEFFDLCRQAAALAEKEGVTLCLECHRNSYTENKEGALELMEAVNSPAFRMYWQPHPARQPEENLEYIRLLKPYITNLHVFYWEDTLRLPLANGAEIWKAYKAEFTGDRAALLEFMYDNQVQTLPAEAATLNKLFG